MQTFSFAVRYDVEAASADAAAVAFRRYISDTSARDDVRVLYPEGGIVATVIPDEDPAAIGPAIVYSDEDLALVAAG